MSNNIYDILKKMQTLETPKSQLNESKSMDTVKELENESKKKDKVKEGAIAEAVAKVEKQLNEKYMGFKKKLGEVQVNELSPDTLTSYADKAKGQRNWAGGRAMAAAQGNRRADPEGKFDRLSDKRAAGYNKAVSKGARDLDKSGQKSSWDYDTSPTPAALKRDKGMAEGSVEESGLQAYLGKKKYGETGMKALQKAGRDGASKEKMAMIRAKHDKMDEGEYTEDVLTPKQKKFAALADPKDKITYADKIAGAKKKDEGNEFSGELVKARAQGKDSFEVDGKTYQVKEGFPSKEEAEKRMKEKEGKTTHGKKTATKTGIKHERDYDKHDSDKDTGDEKKGRGRPKKDKFAK